MEIEKHNTCVGSWFVSKPNIDYEREKNFHVLSGIEKRENIIEMSRGNGVYCIEDTDKLYGHKCKIVVMLAPQRRNNSRIERDLLIQELESETSGKKIAELKKDLSPIVKPAKGSKLYRWTHISKEDEKLFKPFNILSMRS